MTARTWPERVAERLAPLRHRHENCSIGTRLSGPEDLPCGCTCGADAHNAALDKAAQDIARAFEEAV